MYPLDMYIVFYIKCIFSLPLIELNISLKTNACVLEVNMYVENSLYFKTQTWI